MVEKVFVVCCKSGDKVTILKKVFKCKEDAYGYAVSKITLLLNDINNEYKINEKRVLPIHSNMIFVMYNMKKTNVEKYEYFLEKHLEFFRGVSSLITIFVVSEHIIC